MCRTCCVSESFYAHVVLLTAPEWLASSLQSCGSKSELQTQSTPCCVCVHDNGGEVRLAIQFNACKCV